MSEEDFDDFAQKVKDLAMEIRAGVCPMWQCGGELEFVETRTNWQEPDLKCKNCGNVWLLQKSESENKLIECKDCHGTGGINAMGHDWQGVPNLKMCDKCLGKGKVEEIDE